jgi:hypothetical protein
MERPIERAKVACANSGHDADQHFRSAVKMDQGPKSVADYRLTRYAAYLVAMNGDQGSCAEARHPPRLPRARGWRASH